MVLYMEILFFGQLVDVAGTANTQLANLADTDALKAVLEERFPGLKQVRYMLAVDKRIVAFNTVLNGNETIALMPPFSGG